MRLLRSDLLPWWIVEVCEALDDPMTSLEHGAELGLVAAANDALAWTQDPRPYENRHRRPWESMIDDFRATARRVDPRTELGKTLGAELDSVINALAVPDESCPNAVKKPAEAAVQRLLLRSASPTAVACAWRDLVSTTQDELSSAQEWAWRRNLFMDVAKHAGRALMALASTLGGVLDDRRVDVMSARVRLGEAETPDRGSWPSLDESAGLSEAERIQLCERLVSIETVPTRCIVCVAFDHARLGARVALTDRMVFYPAARVRELIESGDPAESGPIALLPPEAAAPLPSGEDEVVAVIDLGVVNPATAVATGASNCEAVVALVNAGLRQPAWRAMSGHVLLATGWSNRSFQRSDYSRPAHWADPTGTKLHGLGSSVGVHLPISAPMMHGVVAASHRLLAAQNQAVDVAGRLLLTVRVIEDAATWSSGPSVEWYDFVAPFGTPWALEMLRMDIFSTVSSAVSHFSGGHFDDDEQRVLDALRAAIITTQPDDSILLNVHAACEALDQLVGLYPVGCAPGRQLATLRRQLIDGPSLAKHLARRSDDHQTRLRRLEALPGTPQAPDQGVRSLSSRGAPSV